MFVGPLDDPDASGAALILFLYRIVPNASLRNREHRVPVGNPPPPVLVFENSLPLDLYYLVTVGTRPATSEEPLLRALGFAMQALQRDPELIGAGRRPRNGACLARAADDRRERAASGRCFRRPTTAPRSPTSRRRCGSIRRSRAAGGAASSRTASMPARCQGVGDLAMARPFDVHLPLEQRLYAPQRCSRSRSLDAVTLERVTEGFDVVAKGLKGKPIVN